MRAGFIPFAALLCATIACGAKDAAPRRPAPAEMMGPTPAATIHALYNVPPGKYAFAKSLSLNSVIIWPETVHLNEAHALGLRAIVNIAPGNFSDTSLWKQRIRELKTHPALHAWAIYDEPDMNRKPIAEVAWAYRTLKSIDPVHPVYQTLWNPNRYADYAAYCDILAVVPYVVNKLQPLTEDDLRMVHQMVVYGKKLMAGKPVFAVIQSFGGHPAWPRAPTAKELLSMVSVASAAGADGFAFYAYTSAEPYPFPTSKTRFLLMNDTPLMEAIRTAVSTYR